MTSPGFTVSRGSIYVGVATAAVLSVAVPWFAALRWFPSGRWERSNAQLLTATGKTYRCSKGAFIGLTLYVWGWEPSGPLPIKVQGNFPDWGPATWLATNDERLTGVFSCSQIEAGWPFRSLGRYYINGVDGNVTFGWTWRPNWLVSALNWGSRFGLPLRPLFPGVVLNFTLYFAIAALAAAGVHARVRRRRLARNVCPDCRYPLPTTAEPRVCPECGWGRLRTITPSPSPHPATPD